MTKPSSPISSIDREHPAHDHGTAEKRKLLQALKSLRNGDFSIQLDNESGGIDGRIAGAFNDIVELNRSMAEELDRLSRVVGKEGRLSQRATLGSLKGAWADSMLSVNALIDDLVHPTSETARVIGAVAKGDLSQSMALDVEGRALRGEFKRTAVTVNTMVDQLASFASEVTRVAREVGTEGKLGGQARVKGVAGTWKDLTDNVNLMASNLTSQVRNIATVTTAVANGDLTKKITVDVKGEILELKDTINTMVDQLNSFASEVTRVAREVGTEGKLGGQAEVKGVGGTWKDLTDNVNFMAGNLTSQVRNIADVTKAVAAGDLSKKITVDVRGEILELKNTVNTMVDQLSSFASEVTRVAREVGTEGNLGGQANVKGVAGTWKDLTDNVNSMAGNLTGQVRNIADVTKAVAAGDLSKKITVDVKGEILELKNTINTMVDQLNSFASEVTRVAREVGTEGNLGGQANVKGVAGTWKDLTDNVNSMAGNLTGQVRNIADVTKAVAAGDLSKKITVDVKGEILELKNTINTMVDQLNSFASEVTRVAREVGTEGKLGGQADVRGVSGTWKDLTDNVNFMAGNLTSQVRGIAKVVTAVANGDLKRKLTVEAKGEIAELADTINNMTDTLAIFADQVTTMAREVGVEGKLGGQASVPGAAGTWKDLTDNVNQLAANLTTQVRAIADVATAVTKGDLTRSIAVAAQGEVAALKDNINEMIRNLRETTIKNNEQDWLKTNLAKFSRMLQGQKDLLTVGKLILAELAPVVSAQQAVFYTLDGLKDETGQQALTLLVGYAIGSDHPRRYRLGESLIGQCAVEGKKLSLSDVPDEYIRISSGLGEAKPKHVLVLPVLFEGQVKGVLELASFERFSPTHEVFLDQLMESIGIVLNTIAANMRTEDLLEQSQSLARELQSQQEELQKTNQQLEEKAGLLANQNVEVERKNQEVEQARSALEEKAAQLALTSKYKSEFLANMSHELRTPLNSLLILSDQLSRNPDGNLLGKQVDYAKTIHASGNDLLSLINDILDLSKIESGTVTVDASDLPLTDLRDYIERTFAHVAESRSLQFNVILDDNLPRVIHTDVKRLQQVVKNLLSNAFKFTETGSVSIHVSRPTRGWSDGNESLGRANGGVLAFSVIDTGIGIPMDKQQIIFEAFQQADGSTSRKYGGTGLGLAISREISLMLGGEIRLESQPGHGSRFTLYLPAVYAPPKAYRRQSNGGTDIFVRHTKEQQSLSELPDPGRLTNDFGDDREHLSDGEPVLLVVDNDRAFATYLMETAHAHGFKVLVTTRGGAAIALARQYRPSALILDIKLSDIEGWRVLQSIKNDLSTRHIAVQVISNDDDRERAMRLGAFGMFTKPVSNEQIATLLENLKAFAAGGTRRLLVIEDNPVQRDHVVELVSGSDVEIAAVGSAAEGIDLLQRERFDCVVLDLGLPDGGGLEMVEQVQRLIAERFTPLIIYTGKDLAPHDDAVLRSRSKAIVVKDYRASELLLDEVATCLHRPHQRLSVDQRRMLDELHKPEHVLKGRKVLVVDDDIRNIFAMTSLLERYEMVVTSAEDGRHAIDALAADPAIEIVLMDIMMPEMDGYDTMRAIRAKPDYKSLPIIALTAKAMKGDREKCLDAGASDYVSKPVDTDHLLSTLCVWLYQPSAVAGARE